MLCTWSVCLSIVAWQSQAIPLDASCMIPANEPTTCYIATPIYLTPDSTLNIINTTELTTIKRFELAAFTNLIRIPSIIWSVFPNLEEVVMANYASVNALTATDLLYASKLKYLNLKGNKLLSIPYSTFTLAPALEILDLSGNGITEIEGMAFSGLNNLKQLNLSMNRLSMLDAFTFSGLPNLEVLDLSQNKIKLIGDGTFSLPNLRYLNMNTNAIKLLPLNLFGVSSVQSPPLQVVDFGDNKLTMIGSSLYNLQQLKLLNLTNNKAADINLVALAQLSNLEVLMLSGSGITLPVTSIFTVSPPEATNTIIPTSNSPVKKLYMAKNKLINPDILRQLAYFPQLEILNLEANKLVYFDNADSLSKWFPNLKTIYLGANKLDCAWLNVTVPVFQAAGIDVYTIKKTKTLAGSIVQRTIITEDDCFDMVKLFDGIVSTIISRIGPTSLFPSTPVPAV